MKEKGKKKKTRKTIRVCHSFLGPIRIAHSFGAEKDFNALQETKKQNKQMPLVLFQMDHLLKRVVPFFFHFPSFSSDDEFS